MTRRSLKPSADILDLNIVPGSDVSDLEVQKALTAALKFISYRPRSTVEVDRKLSLKFEPEVIDKVRHWLLKNKYLDDRRFAVQWKDYRDRLRPRSFRMIYRELRMLGVAEDILNDLLVDGDEEESAYNAAIRMARKKRDSGMYVSGISRIIYPFLRRRGFDTSVIHSTTCRIASELFP